jgi:carboxyl-terminal processing protease
VWGVLAGVVVTCAVGFGLQRLGAGSTTTAPTALRRAHAGPPAARAGFDAAVTAVLERSVDPAATARVLEAALRGLASALDVHGGYVTAAERRRLELARSRGTGLSVHVLRGEEGEPSQLEIAGVLPGSSAQAMGLAVGDHVLTLDGAPVGDLRFQYEAELRLLGRQAALGEVVKVRVRKSSGVLVDGELEIAALRRDTITSEVVRAGDRVLVVLRIAAFAEGTTEAVRARLDTLRRRHGRIDGIVIDLRGNPGGVVDEAVRLADRFLDEGVILRVHGRHGVLRREERASRAGSDVTTPLVILVDRHSASASEFFTAALSSHRRARVIGERTHGKGSVQERIGLDDGSLLVLTVGRVSDPLERPLDGVGVEPDVRVSSGTWIAAVGFGRPARSPAATGAASDAASTAAPADPGVARDTPLEIALAELGADPARADPASSHAADSALGLAGEDATDRAGSGPGRAPHLKAPRRSVWGRREVGAP